MVSVDNSYKTTLIKTEILHVKDISINLSNKNTSKYTIILIGTV